MVPHEKSYKKIHAQIMGAKHAFQLLGVHRQSDEPAINSARRELARYVHPDINSARDAGDLMARVNAAHTALTTNMARYVVELNGKVCGACMGRGVTVKQKGFHKTVETVCPTCCGAGVV